MEWVQGRRWDTVTYPSLVEAANKRVVGRTTENQKRLARASRVRRRAPGAGERDRAFAASQEEDPGPAERALGL